MVSSPPDSPSGTPLRMSVCLAIYASILYMSQRMHVCSLLPFQPQEGRAETGVLCGFLAV